MNIHTYIHTHTNPITHHQMCIRMCMCMYEYMNRRVILKLKCPNWRLEEVAERMHMKLRRGDGLIKRFKVSRRDYFINSGSNGTIFKSSERQQIIDFIIRSNIVSGGAELDEGTELGEFIYVYIYKLLSFCHYHQYIFLCIYVCINFSIVSCHIVSWDVMFIILMCTCIVCMYVCMYVQVFSSNSDSLYT